MGGGIAQFFAEQGKDVLLWDVSREILGKGRGAIASRLKKSAEKGKITTDEADKIIQAIRPVENLADLQSADLVIEAVVENLEVKKEIFSRLNYICGQDCIVGTNASSLSVNEVGSVYGRPENFLGIHFFNPPTKLELVEIIPATATSPAVVETVMDLLTRCGKTPVLVKDCPGFIVNRLLLLQINEAARMADEKVATPADIDTAMRLGAMHPVGPLAVADLIGLDTCLNILRILKGKTGLAAYTPSRGLEALVAAGKLGRKTGEGFFKY